MKLVSFFLAILFLLPGYSYEYQLNCKQGKLVNFEAKPDQNSEECKIFLKQGYKTCFDTKKETKSGKRIHIATPIDHYYVAKESHDYLRDQIQEVIGFAVKNDLDPYMMLAIKILEQPPTERWVNNEFNRGFDVYKEQYGLIPLDGIAVADYFGCKAGSLEHDKDDSYRKLSGPSKVKQITLRKDGTAKKICMGKLQTGVEPYFSLNCEKFTDCCAEVVDDWTNASRQQCDSYSSQEGRQKIFSLVAGEYIKGRFRYGLKEKAANQKDPAMRMSIMAQSFNGYGKFGVSEKTMGKDHCLSGFDFSQRPLYGAGASELMLNSFMANSEIREMVAVELKKAGKSSPVSNMCDVYGADQTHVVSAYTFSNQMKTFLEPQDKCRQKTYVLKNMTAQEAKQFQGKQVK